jgi:hypothetical protein
VSAPHHLSAAWRDADALRTQGQLAAARDLLEPVADVAAIRLGADNPDVIETMRRLAIVYRELGELASARRVLEEALEAAQLRLSDEDPVVLGISAELGAIADELGNRHEARRNLTRVARYGPAVFGAQHPYVRAAQRFLGGDAPVAEPSPEAQAPYAAPRGYGAPPPGFGPPAESTAPVPPPVPPVEKEPGVYRPAERAARHAAPTPPEEVDQEPFNPFASAPVTAPPYVTPTEDRHRTRLPLFVLAVVAVAALVAVAAIVVITFLRPAAAPQAQDSPTPPASPTAVDPSLAASAPSGLKLRDDGDTVTLTWTDPSAGTVPFFVEVGQAGGQLRLYGRLAPGETTYPVVGLNPKLDYCFSVVAVYSTTLLAPSGLVCTRRTSGSASSTGR